MPGPKAVQPTNPGLPVRPCLRQRPPISQPSPPPRVLLSRTRLPAAAEGCSRETEPEDASGESLRISRASAASSFRCHSEAETESWSEASGACNGKGVREWDLKSHASPPHGASGPLVPGSAEGPTDAPRVGTSGDFSSSQSLSLAPARVLDPALCPGSVAAGGQGQGRMAQGWRTSAEHLETRKREARGFNPLTDTYYQ